MVKKMLALIFMTLFVGTGLFPAAAAAAAPALPPIELTDFAIKWWCDTYANAKGLSADERLAIAATVKGMLSQPYWIHADIVRAISHVLTILPKESKENPQGTFAYWTEIHRKRFGSQAKAVAEAILKLTEADGKALLARKMREWYGGSAEETRNELAAQILAAKVTERKDRFDLAVGDAVYTLQTAYIARKQAFATLVAARFPTLSEARRDVRVYFLLSHALDIKEGDDTAALALLQTHGLDPEAMKSLQTSLTREQEAVAACAQKMAALQATYAELERSLSAEKGKSGEITSKNAALAQLVQATCALLEKEKAAHAATEAARAALEGEVSDARDALSAEQGAHEALEHISDAIIRSARQHKSRWKELEGVLAAVKEELTQTQAALDASTADRDALVALLADAQASHQATAASRAAIEDMLARERAENEALQAELAKAQAAVESATASERAAREAEVEALKRTLEQRQEALTAQLAATHAKDEALGVLQATHQELAAKYRQSLVMLKRTLAENERLSLPPPASLKPVIPPSWSVAWSPAEWKGAEPAVWFPWLFFMSFYGSGFVNSKEWMPDIARLLKLTDVRDFMRKRVIPKKMLEKPVYRKLGAALFTALTMWGVKQCLETFSGQSYALLRSSAAGSTTRLSPNFDSLIPLACLASFVWEGGAALFAPLEENETGFVAA